MPAPRRDPRLDRLLLAAGIAAAFGLSGITAWRPLAALLAIGAPLLGRGLGRAGRRAVVAGAAIPAVLSLASLAWLRVLGEPAPAAPFLALPLRGALIALVVASVLGRVELFGALAPWPTATRLLVVTLGQLQVLRRLEQESLLGLRSRSVRRPGPIDAVRGAAGASAALFLLAERNAREVAEAIRARGG